MAEQPTSDPKPVELTLNAKSSEQALLLASEKLSQDPSTLNVEEIGEGQYRVSQIHRDGSFTIRVDARYTTAHIEVIVPALGGGTPVHPQDVLESLKVKGIRFGIDEEKIESLINETQQSGQVIRNVVIAKADPAVDGRDAEIVYNPPEIAESVKPDSTRLYLAQKGEGFAKKIPTTLPQAGTNLKSESLQGSPGQDLTPRIGEHIQMEEDGTLRALQSGFLILTGDSESSSEKNLSILSPVRILNNGLQASLVLYPLVNPGKVYTPEWLLKLLHEYGVVEGIRWEDLPKICEYLKRRNKPVNKVLVADGRPPERGLDGRVEYAVEIYPKVGEIGQDGRIDFRQRGFLNAVKSGDVVARLIPPTPGKPGVTVTGKKLEAEPGEEKQLLPGKNVELSGDGTQLRAAADGVIRVDPNGEVSIVDLFEHQGDVDFSIGNLKMKGALQVSGSVRPDFSVEANGDVLIGGTVESARVISGSNLAVSRGIIGKDKTLVRAETHLTALYAEAATLICAGDIEIVDALMHCKVFCGGRLEVTVRAGRIAGGTYVVRQGIQAKDIGSPAGVRTRLILGLTRDQFLAMEDIQGRIDALQEEIKNPFTDERTRKRYEQLIEQQEIQLEQLRNGIPTAFPNIWVQVLGRVHPHTEITFGNLTSEISETLDHVEFYFDSERQVVSYKSIGQKI